MSFMTFVRLFTVLLADSLLLFLHLSQLTLNEPKVSEPGAVEVIKPVDMHDTTGS